jgi:tricarballylate dehydrogenase
MLVTGGRANPALTRYVVENAAEAIGWLESLGMEWVDSVKAGRPGLTGRRVQPYRSKPVPIELDGKAQLGFGNGAIQTLHKPLLSRAKVHFETKGERLLFDERRHVTGVRAYTAGAGYRTFSAPAVVLATGSFQANIEWRVKYFGRFAGDWIVRGSRYSTGDGLKMAMEAGAAPVGQWGGYHTPIVDSRSARIECGETNVNQYHYSVLVDKLGARFLDEGADYADRTIIRYGRTVLDQIDGVAYIVYDEKVAHLVGGNTEALRPFTATTIPELAQAAGIDPAGLQETVDSFNAATQPGDFDPTILDGVHTSGLRIPKSNWALPIDTPPFYAYPVTGGLTFGFGGIAIDTQARVLDTEGHPITGLYAAGEIVGDLFYDAYPGGSSLTYATVLGRTAGHAASALAHESAGQ